MAANRSRDSQEHVSGIGLSELFYISIIAALKMLSHKGQQAIPW